MTDDTNTADMRSAVLLIASNDLDESPEDERNEHIKHAKSMMEEEAIRVELSSGLAMDAVNACSSDGGYERVLSLILEALLLEVCAAPDPEAPSENGSKKEISANLSDAVCRLIVRHGTSTDGSDVNLTGRASDALATAFGGGRGTETTTNGGTHSPHLLHVQASFLSDQFLSVARSPITETNRGLYGPALILSNVIHTAAPPPPDNEEKKHNSLEETAEVAFRRDLIDLLGRRIFAVGSKMSPANSAEAYLCAPLVSTLSREEFDRYIVRGVRFKYMAAPGPTLETLHAVLSVLTKSGNGNYVDSHLGGGTNLVGNALRQVRSRETEYRSNGVLVVRALAVASPGKGCRAVTTALVESLETAEKGERLGLYMAMQEVGVGLLELRSKGDVDDESEWIHVADDVAIPALEKAVKGEDAATGEDEERGSVAVEALRCWLEVAGREEDAAILVAPSPPKPLPNGFKKHVADGSTPAGAAAAGAVATNGDANALIGEEPSSPGVAEGLVAVDSEGSPIDGVSASPPPAAAAAGAVAANGVTRALVGEEPSSPGAAEGLVAVDSEGFPIGGVSASSPPPTGGGSREELSMLEEDVLAKSRGRSSVRGSASRPGAQSVPASRSALDNLEERIRSKQGQQGGSTRAQSASPRSSSDPDEDRRAQRERAKAAAAGAMVAGGGAAAAAALSSEERRAQLNSLEGDVLAKSAARVIPASRPGAQGVDAARNLDDRINAKVRNANGSGSESPSQPGARERADDDDTNKKAILGANAAAPEEFPLRKAEPEGGAQHPSGESVVEPPFSVAPTGIGEDETIATHGQTITAASHGITNAPDVEYGQLSTEDGMDRGIGTEPLIDFGQAGPEGPDGGGGLAVAVAVNEEDEDVDMENVIQAIEYDPDSKPPLYKNRRFRLYSIASLLVIVVSVVVVAVVVTKSVSGGDEKTDKKTVYKTQTPTPKPTARPTTSREKGITDVLVSVFGEEAMNTPDTPHRQATDWILFEDPLALDTETHSDERVLQRSILALLYFSTSNYVLRPYPHNNFTGPTKWRYCGRSEVDDSDSDCTYYDWSGNSPNEGGGWDYDKPKDSKRWLSDANECDWFGVQCFDGDGDRVSDIWLIDNSLNGTIPEELSSLRHLKILRLYFNYLTGTIPPKVVSMDHLIDVELHYNFLTGTVPDEFYDVPSLKRINVGHNMLTGSLSTRIGELTSLLGFFVFENGIGGSFPTELGLLDDIRYMRYYFNPFNGTLPTEIGQCQDLLEVFMGNDNVHGGIPTEFGQLTDLKDLRLAGSGLSGEIPEEIFDLSPTLEYLHLYNNELNGTISTRLGELTDLRQLIFKYNKFDGAIPSELGKLTKLTDLWMYWNDFTGPVPDEICDLKTSNQKRLKNLKADCGTEFFDAVNECTCCSECCNGLEHGGSNCWQCNQGEYCEE